ncbi:MAG: DNA starvation/stationary phase protection protein [Chlamydiales bacterium]|nr:DNA starvation/stationary phase protection protein [Chlamydiales bacterium]
MKPEIGLKAKEMKAACRDLTHLLADEFVLYTKTRKFHWNVTGISFNDLHKFFEAQYDDLAKFVDDVAERIRQLGEFAIGTFAEFLEHTCLKEHAGKNPDAKGMLKELLSDHESIIRDIRQYIKKASDVHEDEGTANFLTDLLEKHEKMAWMLRSFLS